MTRNQKILELVLVLLAIFVGVIPTIWFLKYGERLLPVLDLKSKLSKPSPQIPFSVTVMQDKVSTAATPELTEEEKATLANGLRLLFHAHVNNLAYYFKYFTIVEFGDGGGILAFIVIFSHEPPRVRVESGVKKLDWTGQRINFDITQRHMVYAVDGVFEFRGQGNLNVRVFYSSSLEPKTPEPNIEKQIPKSERL